MSKLLNLKMLPKYERGSEIYAELFNAIGLVLDDKYADISELELQLNIDTATWGLAFYEKELNIKISLEKPIQERREVIKSKWRGTGKVDRTLLKAVVDAYTNGGVDIGFDGRIIVTFNDVFGIPANMDDVKNAIENVKPAHLAIMYVYAYMTWDMFDDYNKNWDEWDALNLTWDAFEAYKE